MAHEEKYGTRDMSYSAWHRRNSLRRFVGIEKAQTLHMIDTDAAVWVEFDDKTKEPLALIETAMDVGQPWKTATVTRNLAKMAGIAAYCLLYELADTDNPNAHGYKDITSFRVKRLWPGADRDWRVMTPQEWADGLVAIRVWAASRSDRKAIT